MLTETTFTPWASLGGGILIGISAVMVMGLFGKIAGIAGITQGALALPGAARDRDWRIAFVLGLMAAPLAILALGGAVVQTVPANLGLMIVPTSSPATIISPRFAGWHGCRDVLWRRSRPSWRRGSSPCSCCAM